jgi:hypothetical protein
VSIKSKQNITIGISGKPLGNNSRIALSPGAIIVLELVLFAEHPALVTASNLNRQALSDSTDFGSQTRDNYVRSKSIIHTWARRAKLFLSPSRRHVAMATRVAIKRIAAESA